MPHNVPLDRQMPAAPFDPAVRLFLAQNQRPAHLAAVRPDELSPLQRGLLVIDGTVTTFLSAWALESVAVQPLSQRGAVLPVASMPLAETWLDAPAGTPVMERSVLLVGARSQTLFAFAESVICTERLPAALRTGLLSGGLSLGQLLLLPGFESRREGLWYGREHPATLSPAVAALTEPDFLTRTYRVSAESRPLMLVTERFPWAFRG
jgi:chorismate-pyruvate lyase